MNAYPSNPRDLERALHHAYEQGPGATPGRGKPARGYLLPDGTLEETGDIAAWAYHDIGRDAQLFILIQQGNATGTSLRSWALPTGALRPPTELLLSLTRKGHLPLDEEALDQATGIHAQLPFIHELNPRSRVLPIVIDAAASPAARHALALDLKETLLDHGQAIIIALSTLTRHGPRFHHVRFTLNPPQQVRELDERIITHLTAPEDFLHFNTEELTTLSGPQAIALLLDSLPPSRPRTIIYEQRGTKNLTALAAIAFDSEGVTNI